MRKFWLGFLRILRILSDVGELDLRAKNRKILIAIISRSRGIFLEPSKP